MHINLGAHDLENITIIDSNGAEVTYNIKEELNINSFNVVGEFLEQPAKYAYWASVLERVKAFKESAELNAETYRASIYEELRLELVASGTAKPTKDQIESSLLNNEEYVKLLGVINHYTFLVGQLAYIVKSFEQRRDMLLQYGAELRRQKDYERHISANNI